VINATAAAGVMALWLLAPNSLDSAADGLARADEVIG
jgi:hypothetical protein